MKTPIRALNQSGIDCFRDWLQEDSSSPAPQHLLADPETSEDVPGTGEIEPRDFGSRFELGSYIEPEVRNCRLRAPLPSYTGLWAGLTLFFIDQICSTTATATRRVRGLDLYIPSEDFHRYYRHLVRTAVLMVRQYGPAAKYVLASSERGINHSQFTEDLTSRRDILSNPRLIETAGRLYFDERKRLLKRGASSARGSVRRLIKVLSQFDLNFDLYGDNLPPEQIIGLLPDEFKHWQRSRKPPTNPPTRATEHA
jgi:hypothetical protein